MHAGQTPGWILKTPRVGQLPSKIEPAAKSKYLAQCGIADLHPPRQFEARLWPNQHPRPLPIGPGR